MKTLSVAILLSMACMGLGEAPQAQVIPAGAERALDRVYAIAGAGDPVPALAIADSLVHVYPTMASAWWAIGQIHLNTHEPDRAVDPLKRYRELRPSDWRAVPELILAYQLINDSANRDMQRAELFRLHSEGTDTSLTSLSEYALDYFRIDTFHVEVYEQLRPNGERPEFVYFYLFDSHGDQVGRFSLGSYESDITFARQRGTLKPGERVYTFDYNDRTSHATYGFYSTKPTYDTLKVIVKSAVVGQLEPLSKSVFKR